MDIIKLSWAEIHKASIYLWERSIARTRITHVYGIPTGGCFVAQALALLANRKKVVLLESVQDVLGVKVNRENILIVDDLVDSGATMLGWAEAGFKCDALFRKSHSPVDLAPEAILKDGWLEFPWEKEQAPAEDAIVRILQAIGENPERDGLKDTPRRVSKSWREIYAGYQMDPVELVRTFEVDECGDEIVLLKDIELYSMCEHHMLPFHGKAHIAYIPKDATKVLGISKLARLMEVYARRLQVQERIGNQVTEFLMGEQVQAIGAACVIEAKHMCISSRGIQKQHSVMVTSSMRGVFREDPKARAELMTLIYGAGR